MAHNHSHHEFAADFARCRPFTLVPEHAAREAYDAVRLADSCAVPGDLLEAGVWKGGMSCVMTLAHMRSAAASRPRRAVWLFDTFEGLPQPTKEDGARANEVWSAVHTHGERNLSTAWLRKRVVARRDVTGTAWNLGPLAVVQRTMNATGFAAAGGRVEYVQGKVESTMNGSEAVELPAAVAAMRLDTDWYTSTKVELDVLWPRLSPGGYMTIDDYYSWAGARQAVDEWLARNGWRHAATQVGAFLAHGHHRSSTVWKSQPYDSTMPFANRSECIVSAV